MTRRRHDTAEQSAFGTVTTLKLLYHFCIFSCIRTMQLSWMRCQLARKCKGRLESGFGVRKSLQRFTMAGMEKNAMKVVELARWYKGEEWKYERANED